MFCAYTRPRYQMSVYRTIGYLVYKYFEIFDDMILISTHNIVFYGELTKISFNYHQISSDKHLICSSDYDISL